MEGLDDSQPPPRPPKRGGYQGRGSYRPVNAESRLQRSTVSKPLSLYIPKKVLYYPSEYDINAKSFVILAHFAQR